MSKVPAGKEAVLLNLDETAVGYSMLGVKGFFKKKLVKRKNVGAHIRKKDLRGTITHVAVIADRPDVQAVLPQVFIGNTHRFTLGLMKSAAAAAKPANVHLFRRKSSWNNMVNMSEILTLLSEALKAFPNLQPILIVDTVRCHIATELLKKAASLGLWLAPVPAGLTYLLQPLDVSVFAAYKGFVRKVYHSLRLKHGIVSPELWVQILFSVCVEFLSAKRWAAAFHTVGLGAVDSRLSQDMAKLFPNGRMHSVPAACLTVAELSRILPKNFPTRLLLWVRAPLQRRRMLTIS